MGLRAVLSRVGKAFSVSGLRHGLDITALSETETIRQRRYLVRAHRADPSTADDGITDCPLYYSSIEGLGGDTGQTLATLLQLPKKNAPKDYRMVSLANWVPLMCTYDVGSMCNGFTWDGVKVRLNGKLNKKLSKLVRAVFSENHQRGCHTLSGWIHQGASRADAYTRIKRDRHFKSGIRLDLVPAEGVFPLFTPWSDKEVVGYRLVFQGMDVDFDVQHPDEKPVELGQWSQYVELVTRKGTRVFKDGRPVGQRSSSAPSGLDELPMVHVPYRECDAFFGTPAADSDVVGAIDDLNVAWANLNNVSMQNFGTPVLLLFGVGEKTHIPWGERMVKGLPKDAKAQILYFEGAEQLLKIIEEKDKVLRARIPQLVLLELRSASSAVTSGVALMIRLFAYAGYLEAVEKQFTKGIGDIARISLKLLGEWPADAEVEVDVDWGPRFPQDIREQIDRMKAATESFGKIRPVIEKFAKEMGFNTKEIEAIVENLERENEAEMGKKESAVYGSGVAGATLAGEARKGKLAEKEQKLLGKANRAAASEARAQLGAGTHPAPPEQAGAPPAPASPESPAGPPAM